MLCDRSAAAYDAVFQILPPKKEIFHKKIGFERFCFPFFNGLIKPMWELLFLFFLQSNVLNLQTNRNQFLIKERSFFRIYF